MLSTYVGRTDKGRYLHKASHNSLWIAVLAKLLTPQKVIHKVFTTLGPPIRQTWPHRGIPPLPRGYLWVVRLSDGRYCTRRHKRRDGHHSESCLPWKDFNCGEKGGEVTVSHGNLLDCLWPSLAAIHRAVPLMKDAHQRIDVKETDCPTTEESRLALSLFMSVSCPLQLPRSCSFNIGSCATLTLNPLRLSFVCFSLSGWSPSAQLCDKRVGLMEKQRPLRDGAGPVLERGGGLGRRSRHPIQWDTVREDGAIHLHLKNA